MGNGVLPPVPFTPEVGESPVLQLFDDSLEVLRELSPRYALGLITNGQSDLQRAKLVKLGLGPYFQVTVISGEVGVGKPSAEVFAYAAERAGVSVDASAHVGDSIPRDVMGAKTAGMRAIWLNRNGVDPGPAEAQLDYTVASLGELAPLLLR